MSLYLLILWPVITALAIYFLPKLKSMQSNEKLVCDTFSLIGAATEFLLCAFLMTEEIAVMLPRIAGFYLSFRFSGLSAIMVLICSFAWLCSVCFLDKSQNSRRFCFYTFMTQFCLNAVFLADDFFTLFLFSSLALVFAYPIVGSKTSRGKTTYLITLFASACLNFAGVLVLKRALGTLSYSAVYTFAAYSNAQTIHQAGMLIAAGSAFMTAFPMFHMFLRSMSDADASHGMLFGSMLSRAGLTNLLTVTTTLLIGSEEWAESLMLFGMAAVLGSAAYAMLNHNIKRIFAGISLSQTALVLTAMSCFTVGSVSYAGPAMISQLISASLYDMVLFGAICTIVRLTGTIRLEGMKACGRQKVLLNIAVLSAGLGLAGIPFWNGYYSRMLLFNCIQEHWINCVIFVASGAMLIACILRVYLTLFIEKPAEVLPKTERESYLDPFSAAALLIPASGLPLFGIGFNYLVVPILNYVLTRIRAEKFIPFYYFNWEQMMVALITLLLGIIFYGYLRITLKKIQNQEKDGKPS